ncbi:MAG TPA: hypothetical protein VIK72_19625 [Clostridiaceae bacterium]
MKPSELVNLNDYNNLLDTWLFDKYELDGWGDYYDSMKKLGWNENKIYKEFKIIQLEFEKDVEID